MIDIKELEKGNYFFCLNLVGKKYLLVWNV